MIEIRDLVFDYPGHRALHGVSAAIAAGSITALIGPNGAGKTTLMRCLAALEIPFSGTIRFDGIDVIAEPRAARARIGFLQDLFGLYDSLSARRCLIYAAAARGVADDAIGPRVEATAARLGLAALLEQRAGTLSRGQRQRLAIGQAIIHAPKLLILDEPAAGLDPEARADLAALLRQLQQQGMTLLVSSHILGELEDYSTHLMMLDRGRILQHGAIQAERAARRRLKVAVVSGRETAAALLGDWPGVGIPVAAADGLAFDFAGDAAAQAALLTALIGAGVAVTTFAEDQASLEDLYLARLRQARSDAP